MEQLLTADVSNIDGSGWDISYTYSDDGNISSLTINGGTPVSFGYDGDLMTDIGNDTISETWKYYLPSRKPPSIVPEPATLGLLGLGGLLLRRKKK